LLPQTHTAAAASVPNQNDVVTHLQSCIMMCVLRQNKTHDRLASILNIVEDRPAAFIGDYTSLTHIHFSVKVDNYLRGPTHSSTNDVGATDGVMPSGSDYPHTHCGREDYHVRGRGGSRGGLILLSVIIRHGWWVDQCGV